MTEHPILFNSDMVKANLAGTKSQTRRLVTPRNSTVNGYPFDKNCAWPWHMLDWDRATFETVSIYSTKESPDPHFLVPLMGEDGKPETDPDNITRHRVRPRWGVGDRLWGKETFARVHPGLLQSLDPDPESPEWQTVYRADANGGYIGSLIDITGWKPSIFMRRDQSRLLFEITDIRGQRVQEISAHDAIAEGIESQTIFDYTTGKAIATTFRDYKRKDWSRGARRSYETLWDSINGKKAPWSSNPLVWVYTYKPITP